MVNARIRPEQARTRKELVAAVEAGEQPEYLFFWGHQPLPSGEVGKPCLSQWWPASFTLEGERYATAEHWMMAEKARLFGDEETRERILAASHPRAAKQWGREVRDFDEERWAEARYERVVRGNLAKFSQHPELEAFLLATGDRILVEASPVDPIWGIGLPDTDPCAEFPDQWRGENLLGFALMEVREQLRQQQGER